MVGRADPRSTLTCRISSECLHIVGFWWPRPQFCANFLAFGVLLHTVNVLTTKLG